MNHAHLPLSDGLKGAMWLWWQLDMNRIAGFDFAISQHNCHHPRFTDEVALLITS
jgi:hypothetical protein